MVRRVALGVALAIGVGCVALLASGRVLIVRSSSMYPAFRAGDAIVIWPVSVLPDVGDVISYEVQGERITHRVVEVREDGVITQGDSNLEPDGWIVRPADIRGRMVARLPFLGWFLAFLLQPAGWILLVVFPTAGFLFLEGKRARSAYRQWRGEKVEDRASSDWTI
jgi:signal peptidase